MEQILKERFFDAGGDSFFSDIHDFTISIIECCKKILAFKLESKTLIYSRVLIFSCTESTIHLSKQEILIDNV